MAAKAACPFWQKAPEINALAEIRHFLVEKLDDLGMLGYVVSYGRFYWASVS